MIDLDAKDSKNFKIFTDAAYKNIDNYRGTEEQIKNLASEICLKYGYDTSKYSHIDIKYNSENSADANIWSVKYNKEYDGIVNIYEEITIGIIPEVNELYYFIFTDKAPENTDIMINESTAKEIALDKEKKLNIGYTIKNVTTNLDIVKMNGYEYLRENDFEHYYKARTEPLYPVEKLEYYRVEERVRKVWKVKLEFEKSKKEANTKIQEAQDKLNDAKADVKKIEKGKWYVQDRLDNTGYNNIFDAIKTMSNISKMFPVIFYLVAVLISLTSMTRMIEEERVEIGTLKAMGYTNMQIISKYIIYSLFACIIGGVLGMTVGLYLLPNIVWMLYSMIYNLPEFYCTYRVEIGLLGIIIAFICIGGATIIVATNELKQMPAVLMRPKPPKKGKRILLERIKFIWKRFNFSQKVTARNIFRYKKRAIMTIIGIAGCTGLMLTGFGIRDSVIDIPSVQFRKIFSYDLSISLTNTKGLEELNEYLSNNENIKNYTEICATTAKLGEKNYNVTVFVPKNTEDLNNSFNLTNPKTGEKINLNDDEIIISDKIADMIGANIGDEVTFIDGDDISYKFKVKDIMKNYVGHYVFMSRTFYENNIKQYKTNMIFANTNENLSEDVQNNISQEILNIEGVASVSVISSLMKSVSDMLNTMNYVVIILIVASALLAFVVLYNLANINIAERQREIATLKVLGFYDKEVDNYINKENIIFTIVAIAIGLVLGTFLTSGIISSIEIDSLRFMRHILPISYVYSAVITFVFSIIDRKSVV